MEDSHRDMVRRVSLRCQGGVERGGGNGADSWEPTGEPPKVGYVVVTS